MEKYTVSMRVDGRIDIEVCADNPDEAWNKAKQAFGVSDLSKMDIVDLDPVNCYDKDGNIVKEW